MIELHGGMWISTAPGREVALMDPWTSKSLTPSDARDMADALYDAANIAERRVPDRPSYELPGGFRHVEHEHEPLPEPKREELDSTFGPWPSRNRKKALEVRRASAKAREGKPLAFPECRRPNLWPWR